MLRLAQAPLLVALVLAVAGVASSAPPKMDPPDVPEVPQSWEKTASERGVTKDEIQLLRERKFVVTGQTRKQVFGP